MKYLLALTITLFTTSNVHATEDLSIFGWDILCKGTKGLVITASQSDDDFFITYKNAKDISGKKIPKTEVWADSMEQYDSTLKILLFVTTPEYSKKHYISLAVVRESNAQGQYAKGVITIEAERHELNCYVRFGKDETDYDTISRLPFPKLKAPVEYKP